MAVVEQFVKKKKNFMTPLLVGLYFVAAVLIFIGIFKLAGNIAFVPAPFLIIAAVLASKYTLMMSKVEYEYSLNTGTLNIDAIYDQTKRKPIASVNVMSIEHFGRLCDEDSARRMKEVEKVVYCASSDENEQAYYFVCPNENRGNYMYVIEPNEQMLRSMQSYNPGIARYCRQTKAGV